MGHTVEGYKIDHIWFLIFRTSTKLEADQRTLRITQVLQPQNQR